MSFTRLTGFMALVLWLCNSASGLYGQCSSCTFVYDRNTPVDIHVSPGMAICIQSGVECMGTVFMEGGNLCNQGTIDNLELNNGSGTLDNYGTVSCNDADVPLADVLTINNYPAAQISFINEISFRGPVVINNYNTGTVNFQNNLNATSASFSLYNGLTWSGDASIKGTAYFNCWTASFNDMAVTLSNSSTGAINLNGSLNLNNSGTRMISNYGTINASNSFHIGGAGSGSDENNVQNYGTMVITADLDFEYSNGSIALVNNPYPNTYNSLLHVGGNCTFYSPGSITNYKNCEVIGDLNIQTGSLNNNSTFGVQGSVHLYSGQFNNNANASANTTNFYSSGTGVVNVGQNAQMNVSSLFSNGSTVNLSKQSSVFCNNFTNDPLGAVINGSSDILDGTGASNPAYYPVILNTGSSTNNGSLNAYINFISVNYNGTNPITINTIGPGSVISANVLFGPTGCSFTGFALSRQPNQSSYCPGSNITITAAAAPSSWTILSLNWTFGGTAQILAPSSNQLGITSVQTGGVVTFTALVNYNHNTCRITQTTPITVTSLNLSVTNPLTLLPGTPVNLSCSVSNGVAPIQYNWQPNLFFTSSTNNTQANPIVSPPSSISYTITATDNLGCTSNAVVDVVAPPFAHLKKIPDGGYYKLNANKLFFKYDGQYANSTIKFNVYDKSNSVVATQASGYLYPNTNVKPGDNRYYLDVSASGFTSGYYTLELINEKNEKLYLRFIK